MTKAEFIEKYQHKIEPGSADEYTFIVAPNNVAEEMVMIDARTVKELHEANSLPYRGQRMLRIFWKTQE